MSNLTPWARALILSSIVAVPAVAAPGAGPPPARKAAPQAITERELSGHCQLVDGTIDGNYVCGWGKDHDFVTTGSTSAGSATEMITVCTRRDRASGPRTGCVTAHVARPAQRAADLANAVPNPRAVD